MHYGEERVYSFITRPAEGELLRHDLSVRNAAVKLLPAFSFDEV